MEVSVGEEKEAVLKKENIATSFFNDFISNKRKKYFLLPATAKRQRVIFDNTSHDEIISPHNLRVLH